MTEFGNKLSELLKENDITQRELAKKVGLSEQCICRYINGNRVPKATSVVEIAKALNVDIDYLIGNSHEPTVKDLIRALSIKSNDMSLSVSECLDYHRAKLLVEKIYREMSGE